MSADLSPENESFVQGKIASGIFSSRSDAVEAGIELLRKRDEILDRVKESRRQFDEGDYVEFDDISLKQRFDELKERARGIKREHQ